MFLASLPCWLIWPSSKFGDNKIFSIGQIFDPKDYIVLEPHKFNYPVNFKGPATDAEKYHAIKNFAHNFLCSQDPFAMSCTPHHWPELHSLLPCPPLQLLHPVQLSI